MLSGIRRLSTDRDLAEAVLAEAATQLALRKQELTAGKLSAQKDMRQLNQDLAKLAGNTAADSGQRAERIHPLVQASRAPERRLEEIGQE